MFKDYAIIMSQFNIENGGNTETYNVKIEFKENFFRMKLPNYFDSFEDYLKPTEKNVSDTFIYPCPSDYFELEKFIIKNSKFKSDAEKELEFARRIILNTFLSLFPEFNFESYSENEEELILIFPYSRLPVIKEINQ